MRIVGFLCNFNGVENGFLETCLTSMSNITDEIVVYDDASTEDTKSVYERFGCIVLYGAKNEFKKELFHKQELLTIALRLSPDWIVWFDSDAILGRNWSSREGTEENLQQCEEQGIELLHLHNVNLWRSLHWYRTDNSFNDLWHGVFWKNTKELHYTPIGKLHQKQYPYFHRDDSQTVTSKFPNEEGKLIHLGFSRDEEIAKKYFTYRDNGQTGWALDRLVNESKMTLVDVPESWYPEWFPVQTKEAPPEKLFTPENMSKYENYEEWFNDGNHT